MFTTYRKQRHSIGTGLAPRNVRRVLDALLTKAELPSVRFHDLRHSVASLWIAAGVEPGRGLDAARSLRTEGHADLYSRLQRQTAVKAVKRMDAVLGGRATS